MAHVAVFCKVVSLLKVSIGLCMVELYRVCVFSNSKARGLTPLLHHPTSGNADLDTVTPDWDMPNQTRNSCRHFADFVARDALLILGFVYKVLGVTIVSYLVFGACGRRLSLLLLVVSLPHVMCCSVDCCMYSFPSLT